MTETRSDAPASGASPSGTPAITAAAAPAPSGLAGILGSGDHKTIGRLYIGFSVLFLLVAAGAGLALGFERLDLGGLDLLENAYEQVFTLHSIAAVFLFLVPMALGLAIYVVPLQVGAATVAFPRAAAASLWAYVMSAGLLLASYAMNGGPYGGDEIGVDLFLVSFAALIAALLLGAVCVVATVLTLRTAGMSLDRTPLFSWSMLVAGTMWLLTLPVLFAAVVMLYLDHRYGQVLFDGSPGIYPRIVWAVTAPQVFTYALPGLGALGDVVVTSSRRRMPGRNVMLGAIALAGMLGFGAWTMIVISGGDQPTVLNGELMEEPLYYAMAFGMILPLLAILGGSADTLRRGRIKASPALLWVIGGILLSLAGAIATAVNAIRDLDLQGTTWDEGQQHLVLVGAILGLVGGLIHWAPKIWGRQVKGGAVTFAGLIALLGGFAFGGADLLSGLTEDQPRFTPILPDASSMTELCNLLSFVGLAALVVGVVIVVLTLLGRGRSAAADAWGGGQTLEWATDSPPPLGNFGVLDEVTSPEPLLDARDRNASEPGEEK